MPLYQFKVFYTDDRGHKVSRVVIASSARQAKKQVRGRNKTAQKLNI